MEYTNLSDYEVNQLKEMFQPVLRMENANIKESKLYLYERAKEYETK